MYLTSINLTSRVKETENKIVNIENSHFLENFVSLSTEKKKFSKKFTRFRHVRLEEGLFFDYKNGHYKK